MKPCHHIQSVFLCRMRKECHCCVLPISGIDLFRCGYCAQIAISVCIHHNFAAQRFLFCRKQTFRFFPVDATRCRGCVFHHTQNHILFPAADSQCRRVCEHHQRKTRAGRCIFQQFCQIRFCRIKTAFFHIRRLHAQRAVQTNDIIPHLYFSHEIRTGQGKSKENRRRNLQKHQQIFPQLLPWLLCLCLGQHLFPKIQTRHLFFFIFLFQ